MNRWTRHANVGVILLLLGVAVVVGVTNNWMAALATVGVAVLMTERGYRIAGDWTLVACLAVALLLDVENSLVEGLVFGAACVLWWLLVEWRSRHYGPPASEEAADESGSPSFWMYGWAAVGMAASGLMLILLLISGFAPDLVPPWVFLAGVRLMFVLCVGGGLWCSIVFFPVPQLRRMWRRVRKHDAVAGRFG